MDHSSSAHWSTERVLNSTRTCTGGDTTDDARSPASTVPARDEDARAMAKRDYELAKMQQTTPDKAGRAPSTPQPTLERNVQSREILTLALVEDTPSSTTSGQTSTTAKTAQTAKKTTKGKAKGKKTKGKKVMKKSKSKRPQKKTGTASIDKKRVAKPAEGEGNNGGGGSTIHSSIQSSLSCSPKCQCVTGTFGRQERDEQKGNASSKQPEQERSHKARGDQPYPECKCSDSHEARGGQPRPIPDLRVWPIPELRGCAQHLEPSPDNRLPWRPFRNCGSRWDSKAKEEGTWQSNT